MSCVRMERKSLKVLNSISTRCQVRTQWFCLPRGVKCSVGRAGLSIWYLPRHTWGSYRVLVRCEYNFESSAFSLYITRRHMFNSTCKIHFLKSILLFEKPFIISQVFFIVQIVIQTSADWTKYPSVWKEWPVRTQISDDASIRPYGSSLSVHSRHIMQNKPPGGLLHRKTRAATESQVAYWQQVYTIQIAKQNLKWILTQSSGTIYSGRGNWARQTISISDMSEPVPEDLAR
jgi:hypothetical protein